MIEIEATAVDAAQVQKDFEDAKAESSSLANEALMNNGFGDHYLQDSFAAGHLMNKTLVMQWWTEYINSNWKVFGARVSPAGAVLDPTAITLSTAANSQMNPAISFGGTSVLIVVGVLLGLGAIIGTGSVTLLPNQTQQLSVATFVNAPDDAFSLSWTSTHPAIAVASIVDNPTYPVMTSTSSHTPSTESTTSMHHA